ncbi:hypothetical protein GCM10009628_28500 [Paeniglutamicibacter kerguelensis]
MPGQTKEKMDSASIRDMMVTIIWGPNVLIQVAGWVTAPVVSAVISFIFLLLAAGVAKFSIEFPRNKPNEIKGLATLGLSWFALACCVALVLGSLDQFFANPTLLGIITPISGIVLGSAPVAVLWFSARSRVLKKAKTGNAERGERRARGTRGPPPVGGSLPA